MKIDFSRLPSIVWILIFIGAIVGFIGAIIGSFYVMTHVEGVVSLIFLIIGYFVFKGLSSEMVQGGVGSFMVAVAVTFYALMGMALDQTGNAFFNYPIHYMCPAGTHFNREVVTLHPLPGRTDVVQNFSCVNASGSKVTRIDMLQLIGLRFIEYVLIAYAFLYFHRVLRYLQKGAKSTPAK